MGKTSHKSDNILKEASNENTSAERLVEIHNNYHLKKIKRAIVSNPNTPTDLLIELSKSFPAHFLENPLLQTALINDTDFWLQFPPQALVSILKQEEVPSSIILFALNNQPETEVLTTIISHHNQLWNDWIKTDGNLSCAKLDSVDLHSISFIHGNLSGASLNRANLTGAFLIQANLNGASLSNADLSNAYLNDASLINAKLKNANLHSANLIGANLRNANFTNADLRKADLSNADLTDANFTKAKLKGANFAGVTITSKTKLVLP